MSPVTLASEARALKRDLAALEGHESFDERQAAR